LKFFYIFKDERLVIGLVGYCVLFGSIHMVWYIRVVRDQLRS
jgi:hypothetical protein